MTRAAVAADLAANLRAERARSFMGQDEVAAGMRLLGFDTWVRQTVGNSERGQRRLLAEEVVGLAQVLSTSVAALMAVSDAVG